MSDHKDDFVSSPNFMEHAPSFRKQEDSPDDKKADLDSFFDFRKNLEARYSHQSEEEKKRTISKNISIWKEKIPERYRGARLKDFPEEVKKDVKRCLHSKGGSTFIIGGSLSGKTYLAYAISKYFVAKGEAFPSKILYMTEADVKSYVSASFEKKQEFNDMLKRTDYDLIIFDNLATGDTPMGSKEREAMDKFVFFLYNGEARVIFLSHSSPSLWTRDLSVESEGYVRKMVQGGIMQLPDHETEDDDLWSLGDDRRRGSNGIIDSKDGRVIW